MAFPRNFKSQTWFVRLPNGGIEVVTATALERSFRCGLVDARTPVCAFGTHVWTTLGEAAAFEEHDGSSISSLLPVAFDDEVLPVDGASWRVGNYVDERTLRGGLRRSVTTLVVAAGVAAMAVVGVRSAIHNPSKIAAAGAAQMTAQVATPAPAPTPSCPLLRSEREPAVEATRVPTASPSRLTKEQERRLREADFERRFGRPGEKRRHQSRTTSRTPVEPPQKPVSSDPFMRGGDRFDPLNGAL